MLLDCYIKSFLIVLAKIIAAMLCGAEFSIVIFCLATSVTQSRLALPIATSFADPYQEVEGPLSCISFRLDTFIFITEF